MAAVSSAPFSHNSIHSNGDTAKLPSHHVHENDALKDRQYSSPVAQQQQHLPHGQNYRGYKFAADQPANDSWKSEQVGTVPVRNLLLKAADEMHRREAPAKQGYCVDELCECHKHLCNPPVPMTPFDASTTYRRDYKPHAFEDKDGEKVIYGPDKVPIGIDPKVWRDYVAQYGIPPPGQIPARLFYKSVPDTRDFATEHRAEYTSKRITGDKDYGLTYGPDGIPIGVDPKAWKDYVAQHGIPPPGEIPAYLFYKATPDTRDFTTHYRQSYVPYTIEVCPVTRLPAYPTPNWPREHTFWDPVAKKWY